MKVILVDEIRGLGGRGDIVQVKDGYARNYLLPKKLAREATPGNIKASEQERKKWDLLSRQEKESAEKAAAQINGLHVFVEKRIGDSGTLYGSVTSAEIADQLLSKGVEIDKRRIELAHPIKTSGKHDVEIKLHREVSARIQVEVVGEGQAASASAAAAAATPEPAESVAEASVESAEAAEATEPATQADNVSTESSPVE